MTTVANGVNVQALLDAREVLKGAPEAAQFTWRASAMWQNGVHSTIKVQSFFGLGEEQSHKDEWSFEADRPAVFAAEDNGITPIEYLLVGLASCLSAGAASVAQNRGIQLRSVESIVEGAARRCLALGSGESRLLVHDSETRPVANDLARRLAIPALPCTPSCCRGIPRAVAGLAPDGAQGTVTA
jgi:organic hydroperoxide reductase OsmC/OhrA